MENKFDEILIKTVSLPLSELEEWERNALALGLLLDSPLINKSWTDKIQSLLTENEGTSMHEATKQAVKAVLGLPE